MSPGSERCPFSSFADNHTNAFLPGFPKQLLKVIGLNANFIS
jgi:hypothetical protein